MSSEQRATLRPLIDQLKRIEDGLGALKLYQEQATTAITSINKDIEYMRTAEAKAERSAEKMKERVYKLEGRMVENIRDKVSALETKAALAESHDATIKELGNGLRDAVKELSELGGSLESRILTIEAYADQVDKSKANVMGWIGAIAGIVGVISAIAAFLK